MYVYIKSSANSWAVGFFTNAGERWNHESDHFSVESAQKQVAYLNGVSALKTNDDIVGCISSLKRKLEEVEGERDALRTGSEAIGKGAAELTSNNDALRGLNSEMLSALKSANEHFSRFMKDDAFIGDYPIVFEIRNAISKCENANSPEK